MVLRVLSFWLTLILVTNHGHHHHPSPSPSPSPSPTVTPAPTPTPTPTPIPTPIPLPSPTPVVTLAWDADTDPSVIGYHLWLGFASGQESIYSDVGTALTVTVTLESGVTYYFVVTAYNTAGDSLPSNEVTYTAP